MKGRRNVEAETTTTTTLTTTSITTTAITTTTTTTNQCQHHHHHPTTTTATTTHPCFRPRRNRLRLLSSIRLPFPARLSYQQPEGGTLRVGIGRKRRGVAHSGVKVGLPVAGGVHRLLLIVISFCVRRVVLIAHISLIISGFFFRRAFCGNGRNSPRSGPSGSLLFHLCASRCYCCLFMSRLFWAVFCHVICVNGRYCPWLGRYDPCSWVLFVSLVVWISVLLLFVSFSCVRFPREFRRLG